jgi:hypothetical protein
MPVPVNVLAGEQPVNGVLEIGLGAASSLDQCDAGGCMRNKDMTQAVAAIMAELKDHLSDIGDKTSSGTYLHDIGIHFPIISGNGLTDILIAHLRGVAHAHEWLKQARQSGPLAASALMVTELPGGMRSSERREVWLMHASLGVEPVT